MTTVKLSSKNQIVIPKAVRNMLGVGAGDEFIVRTRKGRVELIPRPKSYTQAALGLGSDVWEGVGAVKYVRGERDAWEKKRNA